MSDQKNGSKLQIVAVLSAVEILGMAGFATFPALLPVFVAEWSLSNTEAGWVSGIFYAGYLLSVPFLTGLTDRLDPRRILLLGTTLSGLAALGFGLAAEGFWTALSFRFLAGIGLAGTFMPGLKLLSDHTEGRLQSRYVAFYTSSFSIGASISYFMSGEVSALAGWRWSFSLASVGSLAAAVLIAAKAPAGKPHLPNAGAGKVVDFRPILKARPAMGYIVAYAAHVWELFSMRSWIVAFLAYSQNLHPGSVSPLWSVTRIAAIVNLLGLPSSLGGNELAARFGRRRVIVGIMLLSAAVSGVIGFTAPYPAPIVVGLCFFYGITVMADSASLTAGALAAAPSGLRGATLAVHSTLGFTAAFLGPLAVGAVLDIMGGTTRAWGFAFITMGLGGVAGPVALAVLGKRQGRD